MVEKPLTFADVKEDQFFICGSGWLCQKINDRNFSVIADSYGNLYALQCELSPVDVDRTVTEILPITKLTKEMLLKVVTEDTTTKEISFLREKLEIAVYTLLYYGLEIEDEDFSYWIGQAAYEKLKKELGDET